jgi:mevalonate pyrophosphate decarboxylase/ubiquinone/menaquinone biosynthesis C-methylase UbiE
MNKESVTVGSRAVHGLLCFHGYTDVKERLAPVGTLYTNLDSFSTTIRLEEVRRETSPTLLGTRTSLSKGELHRINVFIEYARSYLTLPQYIKLTINSNIPSNIGMGSSAAFFASLANGLNCLAGAPLNLRKVADLSRYGSLSAAASVLGGLVSIASEHENNENLYNTLPAAEFQKDYSIIIIPGKLKKASDDFHREAQKSPLYSSLVQFSRVAYSIMIDSILNGDISNLLNTSEMYSFVKYSTMSSLALHSKFWSKDFLKSMRVLLKLRSGHNIPFSISFNSGSTIFIYSTCSNIEYLQRELTSAGIDYYNSRISLNGSSVISDDRSLISDNNISDSDELEKPVYLLPACLDYNDFAHSFDISRTGHESIASIISTLINRTSVTTVDLLDVGGGTGNETVLLSRLPCVKKTVLLDISKEMIKVARKKGLENALEGTCTKLPFDDQSFDVVFGSFLVHHLSLKDVLTFFSETFRVLSSTVGYIVLVSATHQQLRQKPYAPYFPEAINIEIKNTPDTPTILGLLNKAGFENAQAVPFVYDFEYLDCRYYDRIKNKYASALRLIDEISFKHGLNALQKAINTNGSNNPIPVLRTLYFARKSSHA